MPNEYKQLSMHKKIEILVNELVENELPLKDALKEFEKIFIQTVRKKCNGNKTRMAEVLGIHRNTLHNLCKTLKID